MTPFRPKEDSTFDLDHWQLNEFESIDSYRLDYRVTETLKDKCSTLHDVHEYLK
jgi:hypothetical protein